MKDDVIVEEIRNIRRNIFKGCNQNLDEFYKKIAEDSRKFKRNLKMVIKKKKNLQVHH